MPPLAPKQDCMKCGQYRGRFWKEGLCNSCVRETMEDWRDREGIEENKEKDDIPY